MKKKKVSEILTTRGWQVVNNPSNDPAKLVRQSIKVTAECKPGARVALDNNGHVYLRERVV
jgi:hypothetical protein